MHSLSLFEFKILSKRGKKNENKSILHSKYKSNAIARRASVK